jgi:NADH-quinone oxidoreductase subunit G
LEELSLLQKIVRGLGSENIDFRLRQSDVVGDRSFTPWLGMSIDAFSHLKRVFVIGSFLRKDHPLLAAKLRTAVRRGAQVSLLHATDDDLLMPIANKLIAAPSDWVALLGEVAVAVAQSKQIDAPAELAQLQPSPTAKQIAAGLLSGEPRAIVLGNAAAQHPQASQLHALAQWIATNTNAQFGYLTEAANTVGGYLAKAMPANRNLAVAQFTQAKKAYVLLNVEPELDCANPQLARSALEKAEMVVVMSPYRHGMDYADVLLPIAPFSETSGTFVNAEGRAQGFNGTVKPLGDTRPAWKVLRVLGNLLGLDNFAYESSEDIRNEVLGVKTLDGLDLSAQLSNRADIALHAPQTSAEIQRVADVPIYFSDAIARRSESLQQTVDAQAPKVKLSASLAQSLGVSVGGLVRVTQGTGSVTLTCAIESGLPNNVVRLAAAHTSTAALGAMFGSIKVEKA